MKKITLILIALITVGCSDPKDKYIAFECTETVEALDSFGDVHILVMDEDSKTFETYFVNSTGMEEGPENSQVSGTYTEEGDHHYLYTWDLETFEKSNSTYPIYEDHIIGYFKIIDEPLPLPQFKIDRRNFSTLMLSFEYPDEPTWYETLSHPDCKVIDVPEDYLASKRNNDKNLF